MRIMTQYARPVGDDDEWMNELIAQESAQAPAPEPEQVAPMAPAAPESAYPQADGPTGPGSYEQQFVDENPEEQGYDWMRATSNALRAQNGDMGGLEDTQRQQAAYKQQRAQGLAQARARDEAGRPVDAGTAALLEMAGVPEDQIGKITRGSDALKLLPSMGQLNFKQQLAELNDKYRRDALAQKGVLQDDRQAFTTEMKGKDADLKRELQGNALAAKAKGKGGAPASPEAKAQREEAEKNGLASWLAEYASAGGQGPTTAQARAFIDTGSVEGIDPAIAEKMTRGLNQIQSGVVDKAKVMQAGLAREAGNIDKPAVAAETKVADPKQNATILKELSHQKRVLAAAWEAWSALSPTAKKTLVQVGNGGEGGLLAAFKSANLSPEEQVAAARAQKLVNVDIKQFAGSAVTGSEWGRQAQSFGWTGGSFDPWKSPAVFNDYMKQLRGAYQDIVGSYRTAGYKIP